MSELIRDTDAADIENMKIVVGCPVRRREWAAESYVNHVAWSTVNAGLSDGNVEFLFVSHKDDPTNQALRSAADIYGIPTSFIHDDEKPSELKRMWTSQRIETMVRVRNLLLGGVRERKPDLFLSLDSDIMVNEKAVREMIRVLEIVGHRGDRPAASAHCVNLHAQSLNYPNYAMISKPGRLVRNHHEGTLPKVDVIMAAKLMTPRAYNVDYEYDRRGEDIGWSLAVRRQGMHLAWTGKVVSKHCMKATELDSVDKRCGY